MPGSLSRLECSKLLLDFAAALAAEGRLLRSNLERLRYSLSSKIQVERSLKSVSRQPIGISETIPPGATAFSISVVQPSEGVRVVTDRWQTPTVRIWLTLYPCFARHQ